jgi:four helix bundle protein
MSTIKNFEELDIWKNARIITKQVYLDFQSNRDFGFRDQIQRASVSVMNNIAEGFYRETDREKINFLKFAKGSAGEVKSMYYLAEDLCYLSAKICSDRRSTIQGLMNGIASFMKFLRNDNSI